jgi:arylsulfatase A-like enzyme
MTTKNILCLSIDGLRASACGAYGAAWCETPALDQLASESVVFDQALVDSSQLQRVYRCWWQGLSAFEPDDDDAATLPAVLGECGFATMLVTDDSTVAQHPLASDFGERVLVDYDEPTVAADDVSETVLAQFFVESLRTLDACAAQPPFFLWLHARGLAGPWDAPLELRNSLVEEDDPSPPSAVETPERMLPADYDPDELLGVVHSYTGQVMALDQCLAAVWEHFEATGRDRDTLLVLTSSGGFPLGEHRRVGFVDGALYSEQVHVPLIVRFPDRWSRLARSAQLIAPADLPATILDWVEFPPLGKGAAQSLLPALRGEPTTARDHLGLYSTTGETAIRTSAWHLRQPTDSAAELYVKPDDRWEANEVSSLCPEVAAGLTQALAEFETAAREGRLGELEPLPGELETQGE